MCMYNNLAECQSGTYSVTFSGSRIMCLTHYGHFNPGVPTVSKEATHTRDNMLAFLYWYMYSRNGSGAVNQVWSTTFMLMPYVSEAEMWIKTRWVSSFWITSASSVVMHRSTNVSQVSRIWMRVESRVSGTHVNWVLSVSGATWVSGSWVWV